MQYGNRRSKHTTTPEPPEVDDDFLPTTGRYGDFGYTVSTVTPFYDFATYTTSGGASWEYDDDYVTTQTTTPFRQRRLNNRRGRFGPSYQVHTTPRPTTTTTTTTEEPPEKEVDRTIGNALFGAQSGLGDSGYCFCSPFKSCPPKSVPRGGFCMNLFSVFSRMRYIRCCFRPGLAKRVL